MKTPIVTGLALALMSSSAFAQTTNPPAPAPANPPAHTVTPNAKAPAAPTAQKVQQGAWHVKSFMGSAVYNTAGDRVGDVNDIIIGNNGAVQSVVIGVGGFLGLGEKEVALPPDQIKRMIHSDGKAYFTVSATKEQLKSAPDYKAEK